MMLENIADPSCKLNDPRVRIVWSYIAQYAPRSLKRQLNAFLLLTFIGEGSIDLNNKDKAKLLFAALCLQQYNEKIYNTHSVSL